MLFRSLIVLLMFKEEKTEKSVDFSVFFIGEIIRTDCLYFKKYVFVKNRANFAFCVFGRLFCVILVFRESAGRRFEKLRYML